MLAGNTPFGIRLLGPLSAAAGSILLWDAGERMMPHRQAGLIAAALLNATLMVGAGSVIMTPDTPLVFFWTTGLAACARLVASENPRWWLAIGACVGLALLSKYTAALFIAAAFIWLVTTPAGRATLATPWPWAGLAIAFAIFLPNIFWNAAHGWVSYAKQGGRVFSFDAARSLQFLAEFLVGQFVLATPIIFILAAIGLWRCADTPAPLPHLLIWLPRRRGAADGDPARLAPPGPCARLLPHRARLRPGARRPLSAPRPRGPDRPAIFRLARARRRRRGLRARLPHFG
jgi:4-amino-4-deoxy-L-arabinose transferase-like glycosyltransferase